jgi:hypothetical protein
MRDLTAVVLGTLDASQIELAAQRLAYTFDKVKWSAAEFDALAARYTAAAGKFREAVEARSFAKLRSAYLDLAEINDQSAVLNHGVERAIAAVNPRETQR